MHRLREIKIFPYCAMRRSPLTRCQIRTRYTVLCDSLCIEMMDIATLIACTLYRVTIDVACRSGAIPVDSLIASAESDPANLQRYLELCSAPMKWNKLSWELYVPVEKQTAYSNTPIGCDVQTWGKIIRSVVREIVKPCVRACVWYTW